MQRRDATWIEPLVFPQCPIQWQGETITVPMFGVSYDYGALHFRGYAWIDGAVQTVTVALPAHSAAMFSAMWVQGWLSPAQIGRLYQIAREIPGNQVMVEIGSWKGRSTIVLGWGSKAGHRARVYAIDPHTATTEYEATRTRGKPVWTADQFLANIRAAGVMDVVVPFVQTSEVMVSLVHEPIGLLFVDGDHRYAALDVFWWWEKVVVGGVIALHDAQLASVQSAIKVLEETHCFEQIDETESLVSLRRVL